MNINNKKISRITNLFIIFSFILNCVTPQYVLAQGYLNMLELGNIVNLSAEFTPPSVAGMTLYPDNPLRFDFIINPGDDDLQGHVFEIEAKKLINYFFASLTVPEDDMWVNLSPYEENRIIADGLSQTEMGRDMLVQDYLLKQLSASLLSPEQELGAEFWARAGIEGASSNKDLLSKIWIVPESATVYMNGNNVFVADTYLKVKVGENDSSKQVDAIEGELERVFENLLAEIEHEVNNGKNFANLRQIYNSMILATWYKKNLKKSFLGEVYLDKNRVDGIDLEDKQIKEKVYQQYLKAFEKGVYDQVKEEYDPQVQKIVQRKYFSGGLLGIDKAMIDTVGDADSRTKDYLREQISKSSIFQVDLAMSEKSEKLDLIKRAENILSSGDVDVLKLKAIAKELKGKRGVSSAFVFERNELLEFIDEEREEGKFDTKHNNYKYLIKGYPEIFRFKTDLEMEKYMNLSAVLKIVSSLYIRNKEIVALALENVVQHVNDGVAFVVVESNDYYTKIKIFDNSPGFKESSEADNVSIDVVTQLNVSVGPHGNLGEGMYGISKGYEGLNVIKQPGEWEVSNNFRGLMGVLNNKKVLGRAEESRGVKIIEYFPTSDFVSFDQVAEEILVLVEEKKKDIDLIDSNELEELIEAAFQSVLDKSQEISNFSDSAMDVNEESSVGGIDFNPSGMKLSEQNRDGVGEQFSFNFDPAILNFIDFDNINAVSPVIVNIIPILNADKLLGY